MARDERIEQRLQRWGAWRKGGDQYGYPAMSTMHPHWTPPAPGRTPTLIVAPTATDARETDRAVMQLSERLRATLLMHYVMRLPIAEQAARLECEPVTVHARIDASHRLLLGILHELRATT